jgi:carbon monoxide dehydrogenase subunit G
MEHEQTTTINAAPDELYRAISDPAKLTRFVPAITSVHRRDAEHLDVEARYEQHAEHGEAWFRVDDGARRIAWGAEGGPYEGWMAVAPDGAGSKVTLHLTTPHELDVDEYVQQTFESLRRLV